MTLAVEEHDVTVHIGDARDVLPALSADSVHCVVTSPPYYGLRDYGVDGQIGLESSPAEYIKTLRATFSEVRRVLRPDGTLWLNLGDSYYSGRGNPGPNSADGKQPARRGWTRTLDKPGQEWAKPKDLLGLPWLVAFALQGDGWTLRNAIIWNKPNAMPESVDDRLSCRYEHVFLFSKSRRYWFDLDPIREPLARPEALTEGLVFGGKAPHVGRRRGSTYKSPQPIHRTPPGSNPQTNLEPTGQRHTGNHPRGRNPGDMWTIPTQPYPGAHYAVMPPALARRCILAGCPVDGVVLDPFAGSGTTLMVARHLGRRSIGIELNPDDLDRIKQRIGDTPMDFNA